MIHFTRAELEALRSRLELEISGLQTELDCVENALEQLEDEQNVPEHRDLDSFAPNR